MEADSLKQLLAIDDDPDSLMVLASVVEDALPGCILHTAPNGPEGIELARTHDPDIILLDLVMPEMDGFEVCGSLKADPRLRSIPIIILTSLGADRGSRIRALETGAEAFLSKPLDVVELLAQLRAMAKIRAADRRQQLEKERLEALVAERTRELERELAERKLLMAAIEQTGDVVLITDAEGIIQYVNPAFEIVTGYTRREAAGNNPRFLKSGRHDPAFYRKLWDAITSGKIWKGRMVNRHKNGNFYTEEAVISPVKDGRGRITHYVAVKRDITESLRMEEQLHQARKMESVGRLAGGVAHDFNNNLQVIFGYTAIAQGQVDPSRPLYEDLEEIRKAARRSEGLTRQLLAFARKQIILPKMLDLNKTVEGMLKMLRRLIGENIHLAWNPGDTLWPVKMDPTQIDQVLANLCLNSRDAIADVGAITIATANAVLSENDCLLCGEGVPGDYVTLSVGDTGCGMDPDTLAKIFEPFFTTKKIGEGTGLGLPTVYGIVRQNHGIITVSSEPGKGTVFRIFIPRLTGPAEQPSSGKTGEAPRGLGETVLVVEDDAAILKLTEKTLRGFGYTVLTADTSAAAVGKAETHGGEIHLLMTDVIMPDMNGRDLAARIAAIRPDVKCLFTSGYTSDVIARHGVLEEGVHFIRKPFSAGEMAVKVREMLDAKDENSGRKGEAP